MEDRWDNQAEEADVAWAIEDALKNACRYTHLKLVKHDEHGVILHAWNDYAERRRIVVQIYAQEA